MMIDNHLSPCPETNTQTRKGRRGGAGERTSVPPHPRYLYPFTYNLLSHNFRYVVGQWLPPLESRFCDWSRFPLLLRRNSYFLPLFLRCLMSLPFASLPYDPALVRILRDYVFQLDARLRLSVSVPPPPLSLSDLPRHLRPLYLSRPAPRFYDGSQVCAPVNCWSCHNEILVFADFLNHNFCPFCNRLQGHFYLYMEPDGPFFGLHPEDVPDTDFGFLHVARYLHYLNAKPFDVPHPELLEPTE